MTLDVQSLLHAIGPSASIVFAAWIFMGFLQQRYDTATARYMAMIERYRVGDDSATRLGNVKDQVLVYKRRCELMSRATTLGLIAANLLILTLVFGGLDVVLPKVILIKLFGATTAFVGFALVIAACGYVIVEGRISQRQLDSELLDIPDLAESTGKPAGSVRDPARGHRDRAAE